MDFSQFVASALAPVVVLSGCAVLVSNEENKFCAVMDRLRALNAERRELNAHERLDPAQRRRLFSVEHQLVLLFRRARHLRDAAFLLYGAIFFIVLTSFILAFRQHPAVASIPWLPRTAFLSGLTLIVLAIAQMFLEIRLTFTVARYELELITEETAPEKAVFPQVY